MHSDDIVIVTAIRTPFCKASRGNLKNAKIDQLLVPLLKKCPKIRNIEIILGNVLVAQGGVFETRISAFLADFGINTPCMTVNRQCASGLESIKIGAGKIKNGDCEVVICGGFEVMSKFGLQKEFYVSEYLYEDINEEKILNNIDDKNNLQYAKNCLFSMGMTSEILAEKYKLKREEIDEYAIESHKRAFENQHLINQEIIPIVIDGLIVNSDDGIRKPDIEKLKNLKPVFKENGVSTAGNSSQLTDGASIVMIMKRKLAEELKMEVLCRFVDCITVGVEPEIMGIGPIDAIKKILKRNNLKIEDIKLFEVNEAFASQALCCMKELDIPHEKYNVYGGSIAIGHPVGATGGRLICTMINAMKNKNLKGYAIASLCAGSGMGIAALLHFE